MSQTVKTPARYGMSAYYPTVYSIRYDSDEERYLIELGNLRPTQPPRRAGTGDVALRR